MSKSTCALARTVKHHPFFSCNPDGQKIFSVSPDIPIVDALETASSLLEGVEQKTIETVHLIESCKAIIDSVVQSLKEEQGGQS
jgi:hypothetical protein